MSYQVIRPSIKVEIKTNSGVEDQSLSWPITFKDQCLFLLAFHSCASL